MAKEKPSIGPVRGALGAIEVMVLGCRCRCGHEWITRPSASRDWIFARQSSETLKVRSVRTRRHSVHQLSRPPLHGTRRHGRVQRCVEIRPCPIRVWKAGRNTELIGTPDIAIEIVSPLSIEKDADRLMVAYFKARIPEYWLVDVRDDEIRFDIFRRKAAGFVASRKSEGWVKSPVLGKSFHLRASTDDSHNPVYTLEVR